MIYWNTMQNCSSQRQHKCNRKRSTLYKWHRLWCFFFFLACFVYLVGFGFGFINCLLITLCRQKHTYLLLSVPNTLRKVMQSNHKMGTPLSKANHVWKLRVWHFTLKFFYINPVKEHERVLFEKIFFFFFICLIVVLYESDLRLDITVSAVSSSVHIRQSLTSNL